MYRFLSIGRFYFWQVSTVYNTIPSVLQSASSRQWRKPNLFLDRRFFPSENCFYVEIFIFNRRTASCRNVNSSLMSGKANISEHNDVCEEIDWLLPAIQELCLFWGDQTFFATYTSSLNSEWHLLQFLVFRSGVQAD